MKFKGVNFFFLILIGLTVTCVVADLLPFWIILIECLIGVGITAYGVVEIRANYFIKAFHQGEQKEKVIALTFDDGPTNYTPRIVEILEQNQATATFFCIGKQIKEYPEIVAMLHQKGHLIGNHTYNHSPLNGFYSAQKIEEEIRLTDQAIQEVIGKSTRLFRPPFGVTNPHIAKALAKTKHQTIGWKIRSLDTVIEEEQKLLQRIISQLEPGAIVLMHDTSDKTANVLEQLFNYLKENNYTVVSLDKLLKINGYEA